MHLSGEERRLSFTFPSRRNGGRGAARGLPEQALQALYGNDGRQIPPITVEEINQAE